MANPLTDWLQETLNRLFIKQPKYFKYWTWLSVAGMVISGIPYALTALGITLPEPFASTSSKFISGVSIAMFWMSKLVVKSPPVGQTLQGSEIRVTDEKKMPFTAADEKKDVEETKPPLEVIHEVPETPK